MTAFIVIFCIAVLVTDLWTLLRIYVSVDTAMDKFLFGLLVILLPFIGILLWRVAGPKSSFQKHVQIPQGESL